MGIHTSFKTVERVSERVGEEVRKDRHGPFAQVDAAKEAPANPPALMVLQGDGMRVRLVEDEAGEDAGTAPERPEVERRVIVTWERGHEKALILGTDLLWHWRKVVAVFKQRMSIEELFRDEKNIRYGWGLRQLKIGKAGRLERLFLVLA